MKLNYRRKKNFKKISIAIALFICICYGLLKLFIISNVDDLVIAQIGDENIYKSDVKKKINEVFANNEFSQVSFEKLPNEVLEALSREIFLDRKIVLEAKRLGIDNKIEIKNLIESYAISVIRQEYIKNALKDVVTEQKIIEKLNQLNADIESQNEYKYSQIVLRDEGGAKNILNEIKRSRKSIKFDEAARKYSIDSVSSENGGEINYRSESTINAKVLEALKSLKKDQISSPIKVDELWFILKLIDVKKMQPLELESSREYIKHMLKIKEIEKINGKFIKDYKVKLLIKKASGNSSVDNSSFSETQNNESQKSDNISRKDLD